jgi:hypothetical protein
MWAKYYMHTNADILAAAVIEEIYGPQEEEEEDEEAEATEL